MVSDPSLTHLNFDCFAFRFRSTGWPNTSVPYLALRSSTAFTMTQSPMSIHSNRTLRPESLRRIPTLPSIRQQSLSLLTRCVCSCSHRQCDQCNQFYKEFSVKIYTSLIFKHSDWLSYIFQVIIKLKFCITNR